METLGCEEITQVLFYASSEEELVPMSLYFILKIEISFSYILASGQLSHFNMGKSESSV